MADQTYSQVHPRRWEPASYHHSQVFRFRHVRPSSVFRVTEESATPDVPAGYYLRVSPRKAFPCTYCEWSNKPHVNCSDGVRYVPANLPVVQVQV